jgi:F-type H+-transporting ATPase subunit a
MEDTVDEGVRWNTIFIMSPGSWLVSEEDKEENIWNIVPFVRAAATDLNFTLALALISVVMTQYYGMRAQGMKYWSKFFTWPADRMAKNPLAVLDPAVGLLEFISELFKIVSFAFRLLGNIFAGQVLLFAIGALLPIANLAFFHLEFAVGLLQAAVFALLTLTFMASATQGHGGEHH